MPGPANALLITAAVVLIVVRQFGARRITADRRWWLVPAVLVFLALREPDLLGPDHRIQSAVLLAAELLIGVATGAGWAWTTRIWTEPDGTVWSRTTKAGIAVWIVGIALRAGLFGLGAVLGVHQDSSALFLALAATLLVHSGILVWRSGPATPTDARSSAYGDRVPQPAWKEPV
ncbi:DUF1453 family protein [Streptomyces sp. TP-A0356]|uniref:DUF1453 family protein n=1 Tax=Streptomyces sp. TP-A0356 TaxID=1359208 RepID=UPI0006E2551A|nr:DUF1453 family protein [Streptomyces sp. TP-A0356]